MGRRETHPVYIAIRVSNDMGEYLNRIKDAGGYPSRAHVVRSMIDDIKRDDEKAHGEPEV